jgi:hypothetical protein
MAGSIMMDIFKSVVTTTLTSTMIAISMFRIGMMVYPSSPTGAQHSSAYASQKIASQSVIASQIAKPGTKRRIVLGENSIGNLGRSN